MSTLTDRLRRLADALPDDGSVTLTRASLDAWLAADAAGAVTDDGGAVVDLTVQQAAQRLGRAPSTLRTWIGTGDVFPTAYKLRHREWRIPASDLTAFLQRESERFRAPAEVDIPAATSDTSAWRQHLKKAS